MSAIREPGLWIVMVAFGRGQHEAVVSPTDTRASVVKGIADGQHDAGDGDRWHTVSSVRALWADGRWTDETESVLTEAADLRNQRRRSDLSPIANADGTESDPPQYPCPDRAYDERRDAMMESRL